MFTAIEITAADLTARFYALAPALTFTLTALGL